VINYGVNVSQTGSVSKGFAMLEERIETLSQQFDTVRERSHSWRPEIQGLRAVAVSTVVRFHLWPSLVSGGYAGVDVLRHLRLSHHPDVGERSGSFGAR
jgi:hypothetical protein